MKLTCSKDLLLQYINIVNKAVSNRTTLPILECILLTADERGFVMTGNDLEIGIKTAPIEAAKPVQMVATSLEISCIVS